MASDISNHVDRPTMSDADLIAFVKKELDADDERQAQLSAASAGEVPRESQAGVTVDLSRKNIGTLPMGMIVLIKDKVERLALSHNPRLVLPLEIGQCDRLRYLNLRWNKLRQFPDAVLALSKLEILDISKNAIEAIPEQIKRMTNLKFLAVSRNQIKRLPLALGEMNLVKLKFDENPIEFPPPDQLRSSYENPESMLESERDKDLAQQVKRFMRAALRERSRAASEEDVSNDSNVETPRPPRRTNTGGRFPVRPSIGGIDQMFPDARSSPPNPPPIPQKSHARVTSSTAQPSGRPAIAPLVTSNLESNRSRSETVNTSASVRSRRQGYVPRKTSSNLGSVSEANNASPYSRAPTSYTPSHSRATSSASAYNFLGVGSGGESSSAAASPIDPPSSARSMSSRKLFSLPESRNSIQPTINSIKAVKRVLYILFYLYRPIADIALQIKSGSPLRSGLSRQVTTANAHVEELDRLITCVNGIIEENAELDPTLLVSIIRTAITALQGYASIVRDLGSKQQRTMRLADPFHIRSLLNVAYGTNLEAQNVCRVLGFQTVKPKATSRAPGAWNSRTVTPTQAKYPKIRRTRGATILPNSVGGANTRGKAPPVPLMANGNRVNSVSSSGGVTPRYDVFANGPPAFSRSSTLRSIANESDGSEDGPEKGFLKLKACCEISSQTLPSIRSELTTRKTAAENMGYSQSSYHFHLATTKCEAVMATCTRLSNRLRLMRVTDPARIFPELEQMFKAFSRDWTNFVEEFRALTLQQPNLNGVKSALKPVHAAVKDVARVLMQSSAYTSSASRGASGYNGLTQVPTSKFSSVSVTPLGAALGPAVRATVGYNAPYAQLDSAQLHGPYSMRSPQDRQDYNHGRG